MKKYRDYENESKKVEPSWIKPEQAAGILGALLDHLELDIFERVQSLEGKKHVTYEIQKKETP